MHYLEGQRLLIWRKITVPAQRVCLGDAIAALQAGIYVAKMHDLKSIILCINQRKKHIWFCKRLLAHFELGDLEVIVAQSRGPEYGKEYDLRDEMERLGIPIDGNFAAYSARYSKSKLPRVPAQKIKKKICYCWDAVFKKNYVPEDIHCLETALKETYPGFELVQLGGDKTIEEDLQELSDCYFYIGFDSGIAHLARLIRVPIFLLGKVDAFPAHASERKILNWQKWRTQHKGCTRIGPRRPGLWRNKQEVLDDIADYLVEYYKIPGPWIQTKPIEAAETTII